MQKVELEFPKELWQIITAAAAHIGCSPEHFMVSRLIKQTAYEAEFMENFGRPPATMSLEFVKNQKGQWLEGDELFEYCRTFFRGSIAETKRLHGEPEVKPEIWN